MVYDRRDSSMTDEELWQRASAGDAAAEEELVNRYTVTVRMCARPFFLAGGDSEDLIQEGMFGLLSALRHFDPAKDVTFKTYAERCITTRLVTAVRSAARFKHKPLNDSISFESPQFDERQILSQGNLRDPEEMVITRELTEELQSALNTGLSKLERQVLEQYLEGLSYTDIAGKCGISVKSVDNAVQRIRRKLAAASIWR